MCEPAYNENKLELRFVFLQKLDTMKEVQFLCLLEICVCNKSETLLSDQVSINVSIPKGFQINCSIDLCYIKTAISETLPLYS